MPDAVADLMRFIDRSPTPYHAVAETARRLRESGFEPLHEIEPWSLSPGDRRFVVRGDGSLVAFQVGRTSAVEGGFRVLGAHTDSPDLRIKPLADAEAHGYRQLAVEPYGGVLLHTWLDRDLSLAGRVALRGDGLPRSVLIDFSRPLLRIPSLAIHLHREVNQEGLKLNAQTHLVPVTGLEGAPRLAELLASELRAQGHGDLRAEDVVAFDLALYDVQPAAVCGVRGEFLTASRLDNLASCHASLCALLDASESGPGESTRMIILYDHEEVGSRSAQGAGGTLLSDAMERVVSGWKGGEPQGLARAVARSVLASVDMAHAVHPNYADRHEPGHRPVIGRGPVLKRNANQSYATDARTAGLVQQLSEAGGAGLQHFASRSDLACGSTIGPISAARVGIATVDLGNPLLSMHSCREMAGTADVAPMLALLTRFLGGVPRA
ncbi:MAG TPA: M18 family aminopeptidase [Myxococcota bacterium]|nr:M18 family aminopeptidase [Myxococcota bacterium]